MTTRTSDERLTTLVHEGRPFVILTKVRSRTTPPVYVYELSVPTGYGMVRLKGRDEVYATREDAVRAAVDQALSFMEEERTEDIDSR